MRTSTFQKLELLLLIETIIVIVGMLATPPQVNAKRPPAAVAPASPKFEHIVSC